MTDTNSLARERISLEKIKHDTLGKFEDAFNALPDHTVMIFKDLVPRFTCLQPANRRCDGPLERIDWPPGMITKLLLVGVYDLEGSQYHGQRVWTYIHNENQVVYLIESSHSYIKICQRFVAGGFMEHVEFEDPFADIACSLTWAFARSRLRALVLYYFLAAGYIQGAEGYAAFENDFKYACRKIKEVNEEATTEQGTTSEPEIEGQEPKNMAGNAFKKKLRCGKSIQPKTAKRIQNMRDGSDSDVDDSYQHPKRVRTSHLDDNYKNLGIAIRKAAKQYDILTRRFEEMEAENSDLKQQITILKQNCTEKDQEITSLRTPAPSLPPASNIFNPGTREDEGAGEEVRALKAALAAAEERVVRAEQNEFKMWKKVKDLGDQLEEMKIAASVKAEKDKV